MDILNQQPTHSIYTNHDYTLHDHFKSLLNESSHHGFNFYAVTGYFRISAYFNLRKSIQNAGKARILVGISADKLGSDWYKASSERRDQLTREVAYRELCEKIDESHYRSDIEQGLKFFVQDILDRRLEMRAVPGLRIHAKFYLFLPPDWTSNNRSGALITGSSNFTNPGLGINPEYKKNNYELNVELWDQHQKVFAKSEFDRLWEKGIELIPTEVEKHVYKHTLLKKDVTPYQMYRKFLYEYFRDSIEYDPYRIEDFFPVGSRMMRLSYQVDAVNDGLNLLERHNGFILADVVGLGKTVVGVLLLRCYLAKSHRNVKALIVAPPALLTAWKRTLDDFNVREHQYDLVSSGNIKKAVNTKEYILVFVDEAHNFRNNKTLGYTELQAITTGVSNYGKRKVVLVTATPLNNEPIELLNMLALFQSTRKSTLDMTDIDSYFRLKQKEYEEYKKPGVKSDIALKGIRKLYEEIRNDVLTDVIIRRTRTDLVDNEIYAKDLDRQGISFPRPEKPRVLQYFLDSDLDDLFDETILAIRTQFKYAYHRHIQYLVGEMSAKFNVPPNAYVQLGNLMHRFFMKRLDSSIRALLISLENFRNAVQSYLTMLDNDTVYIAESIDITSFIMNEDVEGLELALQKRQESDPTITICRTSDFAPEFRDDLQADCQLLNHLIGRWSKVTDDPKIERLSGELNAMLKKTKNPGERVVIFSESEATVNYVADCLRDAGRDDVLAVSAKNRDELEHVIREDFDANYNGTIQNKYKVIVTTDVLAEGINLHRANTIVNYDTPWNSVKLMQRLGRINRVGSRADKIYIYNFFPVPKIDDDIELQKKAKIKIQAFHSAFGEDSMIYSPDEEVATYAMHGEGILDDEKPNERLKIQLEMREWSLEHPEEYEKIKKIPLGSRCIRKLQKGSEESDFIFLKSGSKDFMFSLSGDNIQKLTFLESYRMLKASEDENALTMDYSGVDSIQRSQEAFSREMKEEVQKEYELKKLSHTDTQAIAYLRSIWQIDDSKVLPPDAKDMIRRAVQKIEKGSMPYKQVQTICSTRKNAENGHLGIEHQIEHLLNILQKALHTEENMELFSYKDTLANIKDAHFMLGEFFKGNA